MDIRYPATLARRKDGTIVVQFVDLPDTFSEESYGGVLWLHQY